MWMAGAHQLSYINTLFVKLGRNICTHKLTLSFVYRSERCVTIDNTNEFKLNITTRTENSVIGWNIWITTQLATCHMNIAPIDTFFVMVPRGILWIEFLIKTLITSVLLGYKYSFGLFPPVCRSSGADWYWWREVLSITGSEIIRPPHPWTERQV